MTRAACLALGAGLIAMVGCGHASVVSRTQTGGVLALEGARNKAMEDAHKKMSAHCRGPYTIVREGEFVVGSQTHSRDRNHTDYDEDDSYSHGSSSTVTKDVTEWRVQYRCGAAPPQQPGYGQQPPPPPAPGQQPPPQGGYGEQPPNYQTPPPQQPPPAPGPGY